MANVAQNLLQYTTNAMVAYRSNNAATGPVSAGWTAVKVDAFVPSTTGFAAQLMTDGQGHYRIAMRGTDSVNPLNPNSDLSLDAALAAGKWHPQMDDAIRFTGEAIKEIKRIEGVDSLDQVRDRLDGSGHSAGGGLYEVSGKFYGLSGVNLDGPGMGQQVQSDRFAQLKQEQRNNGLADLQDNYEWNAGDFQRRQYTAVGEAGQNTPGVDLYVSPSLQMRNSTLANVYQSGVELGSTGLWVVGSQIGAQHGLASIAKLEGFGDAMRTQADLFAQQNLAKGLSASGYAEGSHQYESLGGSGMAFSVTVYKNSAGQLVEVRVPGQWLGGTFEAKGAPIASVADANGKVHALGVMDPVDSMPEVVVTASRIQDPPATRLEVGNAVSELAVLKERQKEADSALKAAEFARAQALAEQASRTSAELAEARRRWQAGQQEAIKAAYREEHQVLTAPMAGTVQQLAVHTVGGVVNPAQGLMVVVPQEGGIEVEAQVLNKDVGFLRVGMPATVKLDAFEFTKFGALDGVVQWIAADAVKDERLGSYYPVRIALKGTHLPVAVGGQHPVARLGMAVTADVLIGQRKAYEFFLGPLLKYQKESLRER